MFAILTTKITVQQLIFNQIKGIYRRKPVFKKKILILSDIKATKSYFKVKYRSTRPT